MLAQMAVCVYGGVCVYVCGLQREGEYTHVYCARFLRAQAMRVRRVAV